MAGEFIDPQVVAHNAALSLVRAPQVEGLQYILTRAVLDDLETEDTLRTVREEMAAGLSPFITVHYPKGILSDEEITYGIKLGPGENPSSDFMCELLSHPVTAPSIGNFAKNSTVTTRIFNFARMTHREGIPLLEKRDEILRKYSAPLAAIGISATPTVCSVYHFAPSMVWPHAAYRAMQKALL